MQFDQTRIVIRERSYTEILDLALQVIRTHARPLAVAFAVGALPMVCLDAWLLIGQLHADFSTGPDRYFGAMWIITVLTVWQIPLATAPMTLYLGQALFDERPHWAEVVGGFVRALPQLLWYQVVVRAFVVLWVITWVFLFASRPFLNEIILLERNPIRRKGSQMSTMKRSKMLHRGYVGELFGRWLVSMVLGLVLVGAVWASVPAAIFLLTGNPDWTQADFIYVVWFPVSIWLVIGFFAVVRFLGYLDLRIRREGWEVELMMRAERTRWERQTA